MKEKITEQSIQLFEEKGFSHTSIQDIADALNVTKGTFYYYFSSKEQLLMDIHLEYIDHLLKRQQIILENTTTNEQKLIKIITMLIEDIKAKGSSGRVFFREIRHLNNKNITLIKKKRNEFRLNIEAVIQNGISEGEFKKDLRADMIAFGVLGVTNYSYNWFTPDGDVTPNELATIFSEMIINGITKE